MLGARSGNPKGKYYERRMVDSITGSRSSLTGVYGFDWEL